MESALDSAQLPAGNEWTIETKRHTHSEETDKPVIPGHCCFKLVMKLLSVVSKSRYIIYGVCTW